MLIDAGYRAIFERSHDGILGPNAAADSIIDANPGSHQMLGYGPGELVGLPVPAIHPHEMETFLAFVRIVCAA